MKCLVTKLNGSVNNENLFRLGELRIHIPGGATEYLEMYAAMSKSGKFKSNKEHLYGDTQGTRDLGDVVNINAGSDAGAFASPNELFVSLLEKYNLTKLIIKGGLYVNLDNLEYCDQLTSMSMEGDCDGDIGDISSLMLAKSLKYFSAPNKSKLIGDISSIANHPSLTNLDIAGSKVIGIIDNFSSNASIKSLYIQRTTIGGDISKMPSNLHMVASTNQGRFFWSTERNSTFPIITLENVYLGEDLDKMLINQAKCPASDESYKVIMCSGSRTSSSDSAIATLQTKGYTVSVPSASV